MNGFIKATRALARLTRRPALEFTPLWLNRLLVATSRKVNGRKLNWRELMTNPHGLVLGPTRIRPFPGRAANRRQEGARRAAGVRGPRA